MQEDIIHVWSSMQVPGDLFSEIFLVSVNSVKQIYHVTFNIFYEKKKITLDHYIRDRYKRCGFGLYK